jgi:hypothetical protein
LWCLYISPKVTATRDGSPKSISSFHGDEKARNQKIANRRHLYGAAEHKLEMKLLSGRMVDIVTVEFYRQLKCKSSKADSDAAPVQMTKQLSHHFCFPIFQMRFHSF